MAKNKGGNNAGDMRNSGMNADNVTDMTNMQNNKPTDKKGSTNKNKGGAQNSK